MRYAMKERMWSLRDEYTIRDEHERPVWTVQGRFFSWGKKLEIADAGGREAARIRQQLMRLLPTYQIERSGRPTALVRKRWAWFKNRFTVEIPGEPGYEVEGSFWEHEYQFFRGGVAAATVSRRMFSLADTYGVETAEGEDDLLIVAAVVVIDLARQSQHSSS